MRSISIFQETLTETKRWCLPMMSTLLIPIEIAVINNAFDAILKAKTDTATTPLLFAYLGGTFADMMIVEKAKEGWFSDPPERFPARQITRVFLTGTGLTLPVGMVFGYPLVMGIIGQPLANLPLILMSAVSIVLFMGVYPALYLSGLWLTLNKLPAYREQINRYSLPLRNIFMTALAMVWNFMVFANFLAP
jgi:hypothetical protein